MATTIKQLADGQLAAAIGDLYSTPASTEAVVNTITYVNTHTSAVTVNLYLTPSGGTARRLIPKDLSLAAGYSMVFDSELSLDAADKIRGDASVADKVDYILSGLENT